MNMLRNLAISRRLWMILAIALSLLILAAVLLLRQTHEQMYAGKSEKTRHVVETALGILQHYQKNSSWPAPWTAARLSRRPWIWSATCVMPARNTSGSTTCSHA
jgi:hypothetical protein